VPENIKEAAEKSRRKQEAKEAKMQLNSRVQNNLDKLKKVWERARSVNMSKEERAPYVAKLAELVGNDARGTYCSLY
jgi:hypothetical protein